MMKNKNAVIVIAVIISILSIYNLSFTFIASGIESDATEFATDADGKVNFQKRQSYLDSLWKEPVFSFIKEYTFQEIKEKELKKGLDLQGGMQVILEVSGPDIVGALVNKPNDSAFKAAVASAKKLQMSRPESYVQLFVSEYKKLKPNEPLSRLFSSSSNRNIINSGTSDDEVVKYIESESEDAVKRAFEIIRTRIDKFGVSNPNIYRIPGTDRIQVELPGSSNPERVRKLLAGVAKLQFFEVQGPDKLNPFIESLNNYLNKYDATPEIQALYKANKAGKVAELNLDESKPAEPTTFDALAADSAVATPDSVKTVASFDSLSTDSSVASTDSSLADTAASKASQLLGEILIPAEQDIYIQVDDTARWHKILNLPAVKAMFPKNTQMSYSVKAIDGNDGAKLLTMYFLKTTRDGKAALDGDVITDARQGIGDNGRPDVSMQMNASGAKAWRKLTAASIGKRIAIVLDGSVYSAPVVQGEIPSGQSQISGNFTIDEAKDLANVLKAGKLPAPTTIVEEAIVGPSLGRDSINQGFVSLAFGLLAVVIFMLVYYNTSGGVANIALFINLFFILGILASFGAVLTLPGIAGIVLTMGMSVDANVLIFERIKEELRNGVGYVQAVSLGFSKAYSSIIDSNVTTALTAFMLYQFGTGGIKGFGFTLLIGIGTSFFTAVFITRLITEALMKRKAEPVKFLTAIAQRFKEGLNFDFVGFRRKGYIASGIVILIGLIVIVLQGGLNLGVDFKGGRSYVVRFNEAVSPVAIEGLIKPNFNNVATEVKTYNSSNQVKITTSYLTEDESEAADNQVRAALIKGLEKYKVTKDDILSSSKVGATAADDIKRTATSTSIFAILGIFFYILIRFRNWQFGLGAIVALIHDVAITFGLYAIARYFGLTFEVDQVFIAAVLTIIGYSINDTVVVFDRIREFATGTKGDIGATLNGAINATLSRTIMTSFATILVVIVLLFFGGEALRGFSYALTVGIIVGTYSSIFIAAPIVYDFRVKPKLITEATTEAEPVAVPTKKK